MKMKILGYRRLALSRSAIFTNVERTSNVFFHRKFAHKLTKKSKQECLNKTQLCKKLLRTQKSYVHFRLKFA